MSENNKLNLTQANTDNTSFYRCYGRSRNAHEKGKTDIYHCPICLLPISVQSIKLHSAIHGKGFRRLFDMYNDIPQKYFKRFDPKIKKTYKEYTEEIESIKPSEVLQKLVAEIKCSLFSESASSSEPKFNKKSLKDIKVEFPKENKEEILTETEEQESKIIDSTKDSLLKKLNKRSLELNQEKSKLLKTIETIEQYLKSNTNKLALLEEEMNTINDLVSIYKEADELCQRNIKKKP